MIGEASQAARKAVFTAALVARALATQRLAGTKDDPFRRAWGARETARKLCETHRIETRVEGAPVRGAAIYVANHVSYVDPLVLGAIVPCIGIAKAEVATWPLVGPRLRDLGVVFVRRGDAWSGARALRAAIDALHAGASVLNFPEGTTTRGDDVLPFRRGIFGIARWAAVPIVPVRIDYDDPRMAWVGDETLLPHYAMMASRSRVVARVRFGAPLRIMGTPSELAAEARAEIARVACAPRR